METLQAGRGIAAPSEEPPYRPRLSYSVWLRVGFAGACLVVAGVVDLPLAKSQDQMLDSVAAVAAGVILLAIAWRKGAAAMAKMSAGMAPPGQAVAAHTPRLPGGHRLHGLRALRH